MIETFVHDIKPLVDIGESWVDGSLNPETPVWIGHHRGKTYWSASQPEKVFCRVERQSTLEPPTELSEPTCVIEWPSGRHALYLPESYRDNAPYEGRQHQTNVNDCYTLVCDWFRRERGWEMPAVQGAQSELGHGEAGDWFTTHDEVSNWEQVVIGQPGDGIYFKIGERAHPNHCGVLLEDGLFLHHLYGRLSCIEPLSAYWRQHVVGYMRRRDG